MVYTMTEDKMRMDRKNHINRMGYDMLARNRYKRAAELMEHKLNSSVMEMQDLTHLKTENTF